MNNSRIRSTAKKTQNIAAAASEVEEVLENVRRDVRYVVTDFPIDSFVERFKTDPDEEGDIYVPEYQRKLVWDNKQKSYFVESLLLRVPVPPVFLNDIRGRLEIVDGSQRIRTIVGFAHNEFKLEGLEKLDVINGYKFSDLPPSIRRKYLNTPIRSFVLDQETDQGTRINLFERLNTTGKKLDDAEIRKGVYQGVFLDLVIECAQSEVFLSITPQISGRRDKQAERQELVSRYFVYMDKYLDFRHDVRKFIDSSFVEFNRFSPSKIKKMRSEFFRAMDFISTNYPHAFYRKPGTAVLPRVRFEAIAVGTGLALRKKPNLTAPSSTKWLNSSNFEKMVRTDASNSGPRLRERIEYVRDHLLGDAKIK